MLVFCLYKVRNRLASGVVCYVAHRRDGQTQSVFASPQAKQSRNCACVRRAGVLVVMRKGSRGVRSYNDLANLVNHAIV